MHGIPLKRVSVYVAAGLVVLVVGVIGLWSLRGGEGSGGVVIEAAGDDAATGEALPASAGGEVPSVGSSSTTTSAEPPKIFVQVAGAVRRPGVYQVEPGARVFEAVLAAGGFVEDSDQQAVALAACLTDGCRVYVPAKGEAPVAPAQAPTQSTAGVSGGETSGASGAAGPVSLNTATAEQLDTLPGVGPALARQIVAYRDANGPFTSVDQLDEVPGIGPAKLEQLRPLVGL